MLKCCEIFSIYKKLQYMKKLLLVEKFDKMLCAVKSMCKNDGRIDILFADTTGGGMFTADVSCKVYIDKAKLEYIKCYGPPENDCYDEALLEEIRKRLENENNTEN